MFCPFFFFHINFLHPCICEHCFQEFGVVSWNPVMWGMWSMNGIGGSLTPRLISLVRFDLITQVVLTGISLKDRGWIETCSCTVVVGGMPVPIELGKVFWGFREAKRRVKNKTKNKKKQYVTVDVQSQSPHYKWWFMAMIWSPVQWSDTWRGSQIIKNTNYWHLLFINILKTH